MSDLNNKKEQDENESSMNETKIYDILDKLYMSF